MDFKRNLGSMTFDVDGEGSKEFNFPLLEQIFTPDFFFIKIQPEAHDRFAGREWIKVPRELVSGSPDPNGLNGLFGSIGSKGISEEGEEEVRGDKTTRYKFEISVDAFLATVPEDLKEQAKKEAASSSTTGIPGQIWIDEKGRPRRYRIEFGAEKFKTSVSYELFDFGTKVQIDPPADAICHIVKDREDYQKATSQMFSMSG